MKTFERECWLCGTEFRGVAHQRYCTPRCRRKAQWARESGRVDAPASDEFKARSGRIGAAVRYGRPDDAERWRREARAWRAAQPERFARLSLPLDCRRCGTPFVRHWSRQEFCDACRTARGRA